MKKFIIIPAVIITMLCQSLYPSENKIPENFRLYAYMILLFNENPHFVNKIETEKISGADQFEDEALNHTRYIKYMNSIKDVKLKLLADKLLHIYKNKNDYNAENLVIVENALEKENILAKFFFENGDDNITVDYLFYGKLEKIDIKSPFFKNSADCYNIIPFVKYDELSITNSTFYKNFIFIKNEEMINDHKIFLDILSGEDNTPIFLGVPVDNNIRKAVLKAYDKKGCTLKDVKRISEILLITMKMGTEELYISKKELNRACGISAVINYSPYEGLILLFTYLKYDKKTEYLIAANNFIKFVSEKTGNDSIESDPSVLLSMTKDELAKLAYDYYLYLMKERELY